MRLSATILVAAALLLAGHSFAAAEPGLAEARLVITKVGNRQASKADRAALLAQVQSLRKQYPTSPSVAYAQGRVLSSLGRGQDALAAYQRAIKLDPGFADAHYNAGVVLGGLKRPQAAIRSFLTAGKLNPRLADAFYNAGQEYYNLRQFKKAKQQWQKVLRLEPNSFGVTKKLLQCENALGQFRKAAKTRTSLWRLHRTSKNPRIRRLQSVVIDQFNQRGYHVLVYETFNTKGSFAYVYKFKLHKNNRAVATINLETSAALVQNGMHSIVIVSSAAGRRPAKLSYKKRPPYRKLRADIKRVIQALK